MYTLLLTQTEAKNPNLFFQILIIIVCLSAPYAIHKYTGKSMFEWLSSKTLISWLGRKFGKGKDGGSEKKEDAAPVRKAAGANARSGRGRLSSGEKKPLSSERAAKKQFEKERNATKNDLTRFIMDMLSFVRRNKMFAILPGGIRYGNETATFTAIIVTRRCAIGITTYGFGGTITIRETADKWLQKRGDTTDEFRNPLPESASNARIMKNALASAGLSHIQVETAEVFTSNASFTGGKVQTVFTANDFFAHLSDETYQNGPLDPKVTGHQINKLIPKANAKNKKK